MARGKIPAEVLFIGEAPGESEDTLGVPFVGPAGRLLDRIIAEALVEAECESPRIAFTNIIACFPKHEVPEKDGTVKVKTTPKPEEIDACSGRLKQFVQLCQPKVIVAVGELSEKAAKKQGWETTHRCRVVGIAHPAWILRLDISQSGLAFQRCVVQLASVFSGNQ